MVSDPTTFDRYCQANIAWIGAQFVQDAQAFQPDQSSSTEEINRLCSVAYRFVCELEFATPNDLSMDLRIAKGYVHDHLEEFGPDEKRQLIFASYLMPAHVAREMLHSAHISSILDFNERSASATKLKNQWDSEINKKEEEVRALKDQLQKLETGFNFVGLVHGFQQLAKAKKDEKLIAFLSLLVLATLAIFPVVAEAMFIWGNIDALDKYKQALLFAVPPLVTLEVLLIYFFRVVLVHFRSIKAQLLQIELRTALCQFIQSYASYSAAIKKENPGSLEKFENMIFSGLISTEENLPATFDGTEQLAKLFKSVRS